MRSTVADPPFVSVTVKTFNGSAITMEASFRFGRAVTAIQGE